MIATLGWLGTAFVLASYAQPNVVRLRRVSLMASLVLIAFNLLLGIWSNVALEVALVVINVHRLLRERAVRRHVPGVHVDSLGPPDLLKVGTNGADVHTWL